MNNTKLPQVSFIYNRYKKATSTRKASVELRVTHNYKQKYISTGVMLYPNQWKKGKIVNCPDIMEISQTLDQLIKDVRRVIMDMIEEGNVNILAIPNKLARKSQNQVSFLDFCAQRAEIRKYGKTTDSQERYNRFLRLFKAWGGIQKFEDIKESTIISYDKYLASTGMKPYSKWNNYHRFLCSFIRDAIDAGYLQRNPYKWVSIERGRNNAGIDKYLSPMEFRKLKAAMLPTPCLERVRDLFIFQTYTCLSYTDLATFDTHKVKEIKGTKVYMGKRQKTGKLYTIPLLSPAMSVLEKYNGVLPIISNVKYNLYLKAVAQAVGINKPLSSHWARHTGATLLLNEGVDMKIVSRICGHSSTRITEQVYAKLLDETVIDALADIDL